MSDNWVPTMRSTKHGAQAAIVRASLHEEGLVPDAKRPSMTTIRFQLANTNENGLGDSAEVASIDGAFDAMEADLSHDADALYVARVRGKGRCKILVYSPTGSRQAIEHLVQRATPGHRPAFEHTNDPSWKAYRALLPTDAEKGLAMDMHLIQQMQSMGDPLEPARDVRHYLYFKAYDQDAAYKCARALRQRGFNVEITPSQGDQDPPQSLVLANRDDSVLPDSICPVTNELRALATSLGGVYDGWEAALLKPKPRGIVGRLFGR